MLAQMGTTLTLLLIVIPSIFSANSSLQQEFSIQSTGNILNQDNFAETIFFEYSAESGVVQPPWDSVISQGVDTIVEVRSTYARTGTKSLYLYQDPDGTNYGRRNHVRLYGGSHGQTEGYVSWWIYVTDKFDDSNTGWGPTLGGWQMFWGTSNNHWRWWSGGRFGTSSWANKQLTFAYGVGTDGPSGQFSADMESHEDSWQGGAAYQYSTFAGQWLGLQVYFKIANGTAGEVRAWVKRPADGDWVSVFNKTGIATDPRDYSEWLNNNYDGSACEFTIANPNGQSQILTELYQGQDAKENDVYVDDFVFASEQVPYTYGVGY